jgi:hypothetical protein
MRVRLRDVMGLLSAALFCAPRVLGAAPPPLTEVLFTSDHWPPTNSAYSHPTEYVLEFEQGTMVRYLEFSQLQGGGTLPSGPFTLNFSSLATFEYSGDRGQTWVQATGAVTGTVRGTLASIDGETRVFDTELTMELTGQGPLEGSSMRESPALQSLGRLSIRPVAGGQMIASSFEIFTELNILNTAWSPALSAMPMTLRAVEEVEMRLTIERLAGGAIRICWPYPASGYKLEGGSAIDMAADWVDISDAPVRAGSTQCVILPGDAPQHFYRLISE